MAAEETSDARACKNCVDNDVAWREGKVFHCKDCGPSHQNFVSKESQKRAPSSFRITWFDGDLTPMETKIQGVELILTDLFGNWVFYGEVVEDLRKLIFLVNAEHLVSIARLDAPVA